MLKFFFTVLLFSTQVWSGNSKPVFNLEDQVKTYKERYKVLKPNEKITTEKGEGFNDLYGTRNMRPVLHGIYYRGGANNKYNKNQKRDNQNPLPQEGLENLCKQGFSEAIYFYDQNYNQSQKSISCKTGKLEYDQLYSLKGDEEKILKKVYKHIKGEIKGPMYGHCWNGWHASGYAASITLMQFCGWSNEKALAYWIENTDGHATKEYNPVMTKVRKFKPLTGLDITEKEKNLICP
jgi:hypothetical protein